MSATWRKPEHLPVDLGACCHPQNQRCLPLDTDNTWLSKIKGHSLRPGGPRPPQGPGDRRGSWLASWGIYCTFGLKTSVGSGQAPGTRETLIKVSPRGADSSPLPGGRRGPRDLERPPAHPSNPPLSFHSLSPPCILALRQGKWGPALQSRCLGGVAPAQEGSNMDRASPELQQQRTHVPWSRGGRRSSSPPRPGQIL